MHRYFVSISILCVFFLSSCQKEDTSSLEGEIINEDVIKWREEQNRWIYSSMKRNYLWADQLKDSSKYDYSLEPESFFKSMLVSQDRFSYLEPYDGYVPRTKGALNASVSLDTMYIVGNRRVGYVVYDSFDKESDISDVALRMAERRIDELVVDLRRNGGGYLNTCNYLASLILPLKFKGELFYTSEYNKYIADENFKKTGSRTTSAYFRTDFLITNLNFGLRRVFFLTTSRSASASELLINSLRPYMQVVSIGETSRGKDVGMIGISGQHYKYQLWPITFRTYNADNVPVPVTGLLPDIPVENTSPALLGNIGEPLLSAAIDYILNN